MTTERPKGTPDSLTIESTDSGDHWCRVTLSGEFDMDGCPRFLAAVNDALGRGRRHVAVDADAVTFIDSSALIALMSARSDVQAAGGTFRLTAVSDQVARLLDMAALTHVLLDRREGE
ncbi:MAG TPA: STAS domain-containing protein [Acidimicrobiales bacterium]|nr:STAS domain-containing protein [Acidimicrobiales bacterium]